MKKLILTSFFTSILLSINAQNNPSTYENTIYDSYHGWDTIGNIRLRERLVLITYRDELDVLIAELRKNNKSRAHLNALPDVVRDLQYVKLLTHKDGTVPIFKLLFTKEDIPAIYNSSPKGMSKEELKIHNFYNKEKSKEELKVDYIFKEGVIKTYEHLPANFKQNLKPVDVPLQISFLGDDYIDVINNSVAFTLGNTSENIFMVCESNRDDSGYIYKDKVPTVNIRYFISDKGVIEYVDYNSKQYRLCVEKFKEEAKQLYKTTKFKPAMRNNKPVGSYVEVVYTPWKYTEEEYRESARKENNYKNKQ